MKANLTVRIMQDGISSPIMWQVLKIEARHKTGLKGIVKNIEGYYSRLYKDYRILFIIEITEE